jgi:hypothetical protein
MSDNNSRICLSLFDNDGGVSIGLNKIEMLSYLISIHSLSPSPYQKRNVYSNQSSNSGQSRPKGPKHPKGQSISQGHPN